MAVDPKVSLYQRAARLLQQPGASYTSIAKELGIDRRTLYTFRADPLFKVVLDDMLEGATATARIELRLMVLEAVDVLREAMDCEAEDRDGAAKWTIKIAAAKAVLDRVGISADNISDGLGLSDEELDKVAERVGLTKAKPKEQRH